MRLLLPERGAHFTKYGGPDLSFIGRVCETKWLKTYIRDPDSLNPESSMPPYRRLAEKDLDHLAAYLKSLQ